MAWTLPINSRITLDFFAAAPASGLGGVPGMEVSLAHPHLVDVVLKFALVAAFGI
jgi:hypothetical protein